ncbi:MAG: HAD hydrolase-like protein [Bacteroidales bacterium]|jgi:phosphoglycolate phosphatase|nr:HAD hydrolase-like protein [Bacteroidales bacterium]
MAKKVIIWDWNGTLLNDTDICVSCMNRVLKKRGLELLDVQRYREIFTFPVKDYYLKAGLDLNKEAFEIPAMEFIKLYHESLHSADLFPCVKDVLKSFKNRGYYQAVLSAMEHESLEASLKEKGVFPYFDIITGINDHYAHSKLEIGKELMGVIHFKRSEILLIGDSLHDLEVADELGIECVLVANGHQSFERLIERTPRVLKALSDVVDY